MILYIIVCCAAVLSAILCTIRVVRGPTFSDRVVSFELLSFVGIAAMAVIAMATNDPVFLDIILIWSLVSFMGTVGFSRYLESTASNSPHRAEEPQP